MDTVLLERLRAAGPPGRDRLGQAMTGVQSQPWHLHPQAHTAKRCKGASPALAQQGREVDTELLFLMLGKKERRKVPLA